jgi:hypothetical protein
MDTSKNPLVKQSFEAPGERIRLRDEFSDFPVCRAFSLRATSIIPSKPAGVPQLYSTPRCTSVEANLDRLVKSSDFRRGAMREVNKVGKATLEAGISTKVTAQAAGHSMNSLQNGVTDLYIGSLLVSTYKQRLQISSTTSDPKFTQRGIRVAEARQTKP